VPGDEPGIRILGGSMRRLLTRTSVIGLVLLLFAGTVFAQDEQPLLPSRQIVQTVLAVFPLPETTLSLPLQTMSDQGVEVLKAFETFRARAYPDSGGGYSIGYGMQTWKGRRVTRVYPGRVTEHQASQELERQLSTYEDIVRAVSMDLSQEAFDAFVSIAYNLGRVNSTICYKIAHHKALTIRDFLSTAKVRNQVDWRLQGRRTREFYMLLGDYEAAKEPVESPREVREAVWALSHRPVSKY
jgi:GH24 family phage-related lysozyme (muramidase)